MLSFRPSRRHAGTRYFGLAAGILLMAGLFVSCQESGRAVCGDNEDCPGDQVCASGVCELPANPCDNSQDCDPDKICVDDRCRDPSGLDVSLPDVPEQPDTGGDKQDTDGPDEPDVDEAPPEFESIDPAAGATGVPTDKTIVVTFSEEIRQPAITEANFSLRGPANEDVAISLAKPAPNEVSIEPDSAMYPGSPYTVELSENIRDHAGNPLGENFEFTFSTAADTLMRHRTLARNWAPIIHQGIHDTDGDGPRTDIPTRIDFDGDLDASNNADNAINGSDPPAAHVYFNVTESRSHTFIQYIMYYTTFSDDNGSTHNEHHFAGANFTIERATGTLLSVDGIDLNSDGLDWVAFTPTSANLGTRGSTISREELDSSDWSLIDGTHYPMYIKAGTHETCHWRANSVGAPPVECAHNSESFLADSGVKLVPGDTAETYADAEPPQGSPDALQEMNYKLIPLTAEMWPYRRPFGSDEVFASGFNYTPSPNDGSRPVGFGDTPHVLPTELASADAGSFGRAPFRWRSFSSSGVEGRGQWLLDPAHIAGERYDFSSRSVSLSSDYCYNQFFDIDLRNSMGCPPNPTGDAGTPDGGMDTGTDGS